jgi:alkylation response protein AidB-like acyl-CoA dehydrogenase
MNLNPTDEEAAAAEAFGLMLGRECPLSRVREAEPLGFDAGLWSGLIGLGVLELAAPAPDGASLAALGVIAEQVGRYLAPVPMVDAVTAARLLWRTSGADAEEMLTRMSKGSVAVIASGDVAAGPVYVPGGAVASAVIGLAGDELRMWDLGDERLPLAENLGAVPLAKVSLAELQRFPAASLSAGAEAAAQLSHARTEWQVLTAHALYGAGAQALRMGLEYTMEREQFQRKVASFQAVQHRFADAATGLRGIQLLTYKSAWAAENTRDGPRLAALALLGAGRESFRAASEALHFHGGYGFTLEYDIQLYFRRTRSWPLVREPQPYTVALAADLVATTCRDQAD